MRRDKLLRRKEYIMVQIQNELFDVIEKYMKKNNLTRTQLANKLNVTKGYITQVLNGDFDHKLSKLVELSLSCNTIPMVFFVDMDEVVKNDNEDKVYEIIAVPRSYETTFGDNSFEIPITGITYEHTYGQPRSATSKTGEKTIGINSSNFIVIKGALSKKNQDIEPTKIAC